MARISIIGAGTWSSAIAQLLEDNGHSIIMWSESDKKAKELKNTRRYPLLPELKFTDKAEFTTSFEEAVSGADIIIIGVASPYVRSVSKGIAPFVNDRQIIVNVAKGIEEDTLMFPDAQIFDEIQGAKDETQGAKGEIQGSKDETQNTKVCVLSGPSHAEEVSKRIPTTCVVGAKDEETARYLQDIFMSPVFRVYTSTDIIGMEIGGSLKNVIALAAGMADGLGYGDNTKAALITRGLAEITRLGIAMGAKPETIYGLTGIGDLIVTCASMHSRNRRCGILIGQGATLDEAMKEVGMAVEGVYSAKAARALAKKYDVEMPIVGEVCAILFDGKKPSEAIKDLMLRDKRAEN